ncbi:g6003 [Coccomyxa elongata]
MHPVAIAALGGFGLMAVFAGIAIWELHQQQRAFRESAYHSGHPSHAEYMQNVPSEPNPDDSQDRVLQGVYAEARDDLQKVRWMLPGDERRRAVRALRTRYHPDRYPASLSSIMTQVSSFINVQTEHLL